MRARMGVLAVALVLALAGCSDDSDSPSGGESESPASSESGTGSPDAPLTEITVDCPEFEGIAQRIADAQSSLYSASGEAQQALDDLQVELDALKEGAPDDIEQALTDLGSGFADAAELLENPTKQNQARLVALAPQLADAAQAVTTYVTEQCG